MDSHTELSSAWKSLNQSKAALRHIENRLEAAAGSGVVLTRLDGERNKSRRRGRRSQEDDHAEDKPRPQSRRSPDKSSRSPLRASTQDNAHRPASPPPDSSRGRLDLDSTRSSAVEATTVRVLNDPRGLEVSPGAGAARLERLRQRQTDQKLEKLKERIRRQREQLEEAAQRDRALLPGTGAQRVGAATVRKVAPAPPAPVYKGFNSSEIKIEQPLEFSSNRDGYKELTHHLTERGKHKPPERKITKPVRKIHRSASVPESRPEPRPAISTSSWREGQKLVKMMLGPLAREPRAQSEDRERRTGAASRSRSAPRPESAPHTDTPPPNQPSKATGGARRRDASLTRSSRTAGGERRRETAGSRSSRPAEGDGSHASNIDLLSADIRGILDDLQLEGGADLKEAGRLSKRRAERSPSKHRPGSAERPLPRKRHYDADTVRLYIAKQQEERKKKQAEERRSQREEQERRSQRLHELYRKQREGVGKHKAPPPSSGPDPAAAKSRLQETYTKMLLEHTLQRTGPVYQPSGESDKENKRLEALSPSTSELSEHTPPPLYRTELLAPPAGQFFSHLLSLEPECLVPPPQPRHSQAASRLNRVEALKACAASLSSRIETEARRFVGTGGRSHGDDHVHAHRVKPLSPPERERPDTGSGFLNDTQELPGVGNLYGFSAREAWGEAMKPRPLSDPTNPAPSYVRRDDGQDSSGGSISEGPLSEGSLSDLTEDPDCCPVLNDGPAHNRIALFQKEAAHHSPYRPRVTSQAPWEELNKGSPHSVINIYTKNLQKYSNVRDLEADRSPVLRSPLAAHASAYEDDFVSGSSSQSASRRSGNGLSMLSNGRSGSAAREKREGERLAHSSTSSPLSSPSSARSSTKRASERSAERSLVDGQRSASAFSSELQQSDQGKGDSARGPRRSSGGSGGGSSSTLTSGRSPHSSGLTEVPPFPRSPARSPRAPDSSASSPSSARDSAPKATSSPGPAPNSTVYPSGPAHSSADLQYTPAALQQRLSAELSFLGVVEDSVRQLSDVERVRAVTLAQQESVSLAQILKAQQQRQERELQLLQLKADQEALQSQKQLQESRERAAQAHAELCESLVQSHQKALLELQESSSKMINQQAEAAQHLREMTELTHSQVPSVTPGRQPRPQTDRSEVSERTLSHTADTPNSSLTESEPSRRHNRVRVRDEGSMDRSSSVDEEVNTAQDDSLQTDKAGSVSVGYSQGLEESVTEDELEKSFRSLLPSEAHWRGSVERKRQSDEEQQQQQEKSPPKDGCVPVFSGDQYSFSEFTMAMVKQYMQEEEVRSQHHGSLLRLRHRALKEKTRAELAWLELQKRHLRDKGEDDKMPPIRKKQRGLLLKLQQEQAEIRRLQEVNRAARRERKLLLKQQEEIERIQHTTLRLKEKLRHAGDARQRSPVSGESEDLTPLTELEAESRSPSPLSVSGSETSSIMKKLKKMSYHTDERFLTQRELRLVHWRQQVEAELRRTDKEEPQIKGRVLTERQLKEDGSSHTQQDGQAGQDVRSEDESSLVSSIHTLQECENTHTHGAVSSSSKVTTHSNSRKNDLHSSAPTSEAASDQSDIEGRVLALRAELRRRKAEVQRLKKEQRVRQKERLKAQEASLLKQLESYNDFIEKTKAELSKADHPPSAKPQIKTPTSGSHTKPRAESPAVQRAEEESLRERSSSHQSESEISERLHSESPCLSDEDPPTVTPTPVFGSPEHLSPLESERSSRTHPESVASSPRSVVTEEISEDLSGSRSEQKSEPLVHLKVQEFIQLEEEEQPQSGSSVLNKLSAEEPKEEPIAVAYQLKEVVDGSHTPEESGRKEGEAEPSADVYNDDFESLGSSVQEGHRVSEEKSYKFSFSSEEEEEVEKEEMGIHSGDPERDQVLQVTLKDELPGFSVGDRVLVSNVQPGTLRFKGQTGFAEGFWAGVELDVSEGSNDGTYGGVSYFQCRDKHGIFAPPDKISHLEPEAGPESTAEEDSSYDEELRNKKPAPSEEASEQARDGSDDILNYLSQRNSMGGAEEDPTRQEDQKPKPIDVLDLLVQSDSAKPDDLQEAGGDQQAAGLTGLADTLIQSFVSDALKQVQQIRKAKEEKISAANHLVFFSDDEEQNEYHFPMISVRPDIHGFLNRYQDGASSPELCNRSESPVLGQEELVQRLAELELNREFLHVLSDDQDWFDEDFGLSSRKNAQQKGRVRPEEPPSSPPGKPQQLRRQQQQEEPAMLVPHSGPELQKLVSAALLEIWSSCKLDQGTQNLTSAAKPQPSGALLGAEEEEQCVRSYKQSVFDLAWEFMQEVFAEDPNADRPQWIKPRRASSSHIHRISNTSNLAQVQEFVSGEVLKIYGLRREQNHRTDWQKMLKFGRKKRDRVDHILVQELHEEEALWVNYDEDELFVKMQLADGILDTLLKDTIDVLLNIHQRRSSRAVS